MNKNKIAFIVEGAKSEPLILKNLSKCLFDKFNMEIITLSSSCNIYVLWQALKRDDFDVDIIEVIKEMHSHNQTNKEAIAALKSDEFSEVYLFFDYDGHQRNLPKECNGDKVIQEMLESFSNETEMGKLFISYPMVEAIRDYHEEYGICHRCTCEAYKNVNYKNQTSNFARFQNVTKLNIQDWDALIEIFLLRSKCLLSLEDMSAYVENEISPIQIFEQQLTKFIMPYQKVMVLSAFPEFLIEYFGKRLFNDHHEILPLLNFTSN